MKLESNELEAVRQLSRGQHGRVFAQALGRLLADADSNLRKARGENIGPMQGRAQTLAELRDLWSSQS